MSVARSGSTAAAVIALDGVVITAVGIDAFDCPVCQEPTDLVVPDCGDGHGDCPDRACARCGFALTLTMLTGFTSTAGRGAA